jgi:hypothetical protein
MQFGYWIVGDMSHISLLLSEEDQNPFAASVRVLDKYGIGLKRGVRLVRNAQS